MRIIPAFAIILAIAAPAYADCAYSDTRCLSDKMEWESRHAGDAILFPGRTPTWGRPTAMDEMQQRWARERRDEEMREEGRWQGREEAASMEDWGRPPHR